VLFEQSIHGRPQLIVIHGLYQTAGPLNPNIAETIFNAAKTSAGVVSALPQLGTHWVFTGCRVRDLRSPNNPDIPSTGTSVPGTAAGTPLPDQSSIVVTLRTALAGRSFRGRSYTFGWTDAAMNTDGTISDAAAAAALGLINGFLIGIAAGGAFGAIHSPALPARPAHGGGTLPAKDYAITQISSVEVRDRIWDTNRRRIDTLRR
jgi:hypothetical protein